MVFQTAALMIRSRGPDKFWNRRKIFKLAAHFIGRRRNCYSIAIRNVHRALVFATKGRQLKKEDMAEALTQIAWTKMRADGDPDAKDIDAVPPNNVFIQSPKND